MFLFVLYAVMSWYFAAKYRRMWRGGFSVIASLLGLILIGWLHIKLSQWTKGTVSLPMMQMLLYPYAIMVVAVGVFLIVLPRRIDQPGHCQMCGYDLEGLEIMPGRVWLVCPECGEDHCPRTLRRAVDVERERELSLARSATRPPRRVPQQAAQPSIPSAAG
jgi:hypothetical protein